MQRHFIKSLLKDIEDDKWYEISTVFFLFIIIIFFFGSVAMQLTMPSCRPFCMGVTVDDEVVLLENVIDTPQLKGETEDGRTVLLKEYKWVEYCEDE